MKGARVQIQRSKKARRAGSAKAAVTHGAANQILEQMSKLSELASNDEQTENLRFQVLVSTRRIEQLLHEV